jgi:hypothetical protein
MDLTFLHGDDIMVYTIKGPYEGSIFGRLGRGIGQGINEQLPKEIESQRQANAIEGLAKNKGKPLEQAAALRRAHVPAHEINTYLGLAQRQQEREAEFPDEQPNYNINNVSQTQPTVRGQVPNTQTPNIHAPNPETGFVSREALSESEARIKQKPQWKEINDLAKNKYKSIYPNASPEELREKAKNELYIDYEAQKVGLADLEEDINKKIKLALQGEGFGHYEDVSGEIQKELLRQAKHMYTDQGLNPQQIGSNISDIMIEMGIANNALKEISGEGIFRTSEKINQAKILRKDFEKYNFGGIFDKLASAHLGWSEPLVAHELDPVKNEKINDIFNKYPEKKFFSRMDSTGKIPEKIKDADVDSVIKNIRKGDNLLDIEYKLRQRGYSIDKFRKKISESNLDLDHDQRRQIKSPIDHAWWPDIFAEIFK